MDIVNNKNSLLLLEGEDTRYLSRLLERAVNLEFAPTPEVMEVLHEQYKPLRFKPGLLPPTDHPLAAAHQRVAQHRAYGFAKEHRPIISIGPNPVQFMKIAQNAPDVHGCCLFSRKDGCRDQPRFASAAASVAVRSCRDREYTRAVTCLAMGMETEKFCVRGYQNCDKQAPFAIAIHSLYDVCFRDLAIGFQEHGTQILQAWMHVPLAALQVDKFTDIENRTWFEKYETSETIPLKERGLKNILTTKRKETRIRFGFLEDASFLYDHDYDTWMNYMKVGGFPTPFGFNITIEKVRHNGSHWEFKICRSNCGGLVQQCISSGLTNVTRIPDLFEMAKTNFCKYKKMRYIIGDRDKVSRLFHYMVARRDGDFTLAAALAYARSMLRSIKLGDRLVDTKWNVDEDTLINTTACVYILALIYKRKANEIIGLTQHHINKLDAKRGWWTRCVGKVTPDWLENAFHHVRELLGGCEPSKLITGETRNHFAHFDMGFYNDILTKDHLVEFDYVDEVCFDLLPTKEEAPNADMLARASRTDEQTVELANAIQAVKPDAAKPILLPWAVGYGIQAAMPSKSGVEGIERAYDAQDQHSIMTAECERAAADPSTHPALASTLKAAAAAFKADKLVRFQSDRMCLLLGPAGAGKSTVMREKTLPAFEAAHPGEIALFITPTRDLQIKYQTTISHPHCAKTMHSAAKALASRNIRPSLIIVDECFLYPLPYLCWLTRFSKVVLLGDTQQLGHVDFGNMWNGCVKLEEMLHLIYTETLTTTHRMPQDIAALPFIELQYPGLNTTSKVKTSIHFVGPKFTKPGAQLITALQATKDRFGNGARTIHEVHGGTFEDVILHLDGSPAEKNLLKKSRAHLTVGLTRHKKNLFVREEEDGLLTTYMNMDPALVILADPSGTNVIAPELPVEPDQRSTQVTVMPSTDAAYVPQDVTTDLAMDILQKLYPGPTETHEYQAVTTTDIPNDGGAKGTIRPDALDGDTDYESKRHVVHRFPGAQRVKITNARHQMVALSSLMARYAKKTKMLKRQSAQIEAKILFDALSNYVDYQVRPEWRETVYMEAIEKFQARGHDLDDLKDIDCWTDQGAHKVSFNIKTQQKPCLGKDPTTTNKAGQGIAAWQKTLNFTMIVWTRMLEKTFMEAADSKFHFISKYTDDEIMGLLQSITEGKTYDFLEGDWTEFDSSQNNVEHELLMMQLEAIGCPAELRDLFMQMMLKRGVHCPFASLQVQSKKDSGRVDTLIGNTSFNAGVMLTLVDLETIDHVLFKGDDSLMLGHNIQLNTARVEELESNCGFKLKLGIRKTSEFVSFIVNQNGVALNFARLAAKVATRSYRNIEDFSDYRKAIGATLLPCRNTYVASNMVRTNAAHFNVNEEQIDMLLSFLVSFARGYIKFSHTTAFENMTLTLDVTSARCVPPLATTATPAGKIATVDTATEPMNVCKYTRRPEDCIHNSCRRKTGKGMRILGTVLNALS